MWEKQLVDPPIHYLVQNSTIPKLVLFILSVFWVLLFQSNGQFLVLCFWCIMFFTFLVLWVLSTDPARYVAVILFPIFSKFTYLFVWQQYSVVPALFGWVRMKMGLGLMGKLGGAWVVVWVSAWWGVF